MNWHPVLECDDDEGNPYVWASEINSEKYGKYVWISNMGDNEYEITTSRYSSPNGDAIKVCKSLASAKRWVSMNIR